MPSSNRRLWANAVGLLAALATAAAMLATVGVGLGFVAVWTCVPAHSADPDAAGCSPFEIKMRLVLVLALCVLPVWPVFAFAKRWVLRRVNLR